MNEKTLPENIFDVLNSESGFRHGTAFLGVFQRRKGKQPFIVTAGHVVQNRRVDVKDQLGRKVPVRFHQLQDRDVAMGLLPDRLSYIQGIPIAYALFQQKEDVYLVSRRGSRVIEKRGRVRGRLLPGVLFYQFEEGDGGEGTSGSPILNEQGQVIAIHTGSGHRLVDGSTDGRALGELLVPTTKPSVIDRAKMSFNILAFFLGF